MNKPISYIIILFGLLFLTACHHGVPDIEDEKTEGKTVERTVIVYMVAENSLSSYARSDSVEMAQALKYIGDDYNLVVYKDATQLPAIYWFTDRKGVRKWRTYHKEQDSCDSLVMLKALRDATKAFPARHYGLVLWSHASGWVPKIEDEVPEEQTTRRKTFGIDNQQGLTVNHGSEMEIHSLRWVLEQMPQKFDFILMDACFMQNIETAYELKDVADYLIGSPAEIPAYGAPYTEVMEPMMQGDAIGIAEQYFNHYRKGYGVALSVIDCNRLSILARKTAQYLPRLCNAKGEISTTNVQNYVPYCAGFRWRPEGYDMKSIMNKHLDRNEYDDWLSALDYAVPFQKSTSTWSSAFVGSHSYLTDAEHYCGVSMFIPNVKYDNMQWNEKFRQTSWYKAVDWKQTGW